MNYLGLDLSTQSISAVVLNDSGNILWQDSLSFNELEFPLCALKNGVVQASEGEVWAPPALWVMALERILESMVKHGPPVAELVAIGGSAQQHGSVWTGADFASSLHEPNDIPLSERISDLLSRPRAPVWQDHSTSQACSDLQRFSFKKQTVESITGSLPTLRFTGPQIYRISRTEKSRYENTRTIHLISSFVCSLLLGKSAPVDYAQSSGTGLFNIDELDWHPELCQFTAPELFKRLPDPVPFGTVVGCVSPYWQKRFGFSPTCAVHVFTGDNPASLIAMDLVADSAIGISLGSSFTLFVASEQRPKRPEEGHVFNSPFGNYYHLSCFANGALAQQKFASSLGLNNVKDMELMAAKASKGCGGGVLLPFVFAEITPFAPAQVYRFGLEGASTETQARAFFEAQAMSLRLRAKKDISNCDELRLCGGAASPFFAQLLADVFGKPVLAVSQEHALAAFGVAWGARTCFKEDDETLDNPLCHLKVTSYEPDLLSHRLYTELLEIYNAFEDFILKKGKSPEKKRAHFSRSWR